MHRAELPTGTVTFLFTDIEGSTRLLQELGVRYRDVQDRHTAILRQAIAEHDGVEVRTEGDSFFATFRTPSQALGAAVAGQRTLAAQEWPHGGSLRVRMGMHTGEGVLGGDDYIGLDVNRAARIGAAGWGGQIVISDATRSLIHHGLPHGVSIRSQGIHRLKDLVQPEHLHDVVIGGLSAEFPALRTLEVPVTLPTEPTSFVGREREIAQGVELLGRTHLLTLTGPGGTGKTRLAVRIAATVAADFPDGVAFVDLSAISDPALVIPTIAAAVGIREEGWERPAREALEGHVAEREALLVLDNFEQVLEAADDVGRLLAVSTRSKVLATSRSPLRLRGEQELRVMPLPVPDVNTASTVEDLSRSEAMALFAHRAAAVAPDFELDEENVLHVAGICAHLDGLPLAIELAASRAGLLSPSAMLSRMERHLPLLDEGPRDLPARQRTLQATVEWSYELLPDRERLLFRRLSAMVGGATLEAAETVCLVEDSDGASVLERMSALVDSSLVHAIRTGSAEPRFDMLNTVREFGLERLDAEDDRAEIERRHVAWFLRLAETAEPAFRGPEIERWLWTLEVEHDNLRAALRQAVEEQDADVALRLVASLFRFWHLAGHIPEGIRWARAVLCLPGAQGRTSTRAGALATLGGLSYWRNDFATTRTAYEEALEISTELEDLPAMAKGSYNLAFAYRLQQDASGARELLERARAMFDRLRDRRGVADCLWALSLLARLEGEIETARSLSEEGLRLHRQLGDLFGVIDSLHVRARAAYEMGELDVARASVMESLAMLGSAGYRTGIAIALDNLAAQENELGRPVRAVRLGGASEALREDAGAQAPPEFIDLPDPRERARGSLSPEQIAALWEEGRAMNLEAVLRYAREEP
jgi:predicted ATPase/class 3 adenylate cyclase